MITTALMLPPFRASPKRDALDHLRLAADVHIARPVRKLIGAKMPRLTASPF
jgi:hypothetical protein